MTKAQHYRKWVLLNRDARRRIDRDFYLRNRARIRKRQQEYAEKNRAALNARARARYLANPQPYKAREYARRAQMEVSTQNPRSIQIFMEGVRRKKSAVCYYCHRRVPSKQIEFDHIIPLSRGGGHSVENLCVSCKHCNRSKNNRLLADFLALGQQLLEV